MITVAGVSYEFGEEVRIVEKIRKGEGATTAKSSFTNKTATFLGAFKERNGDDLESFTAILNGYNGRIFVKLSDIEKIVKEDESE